MFDRLKRALREALGTDEETVLLYTRARHIAEARLAKVDPDECVNQRVLNRVRALQVIAEERGRFLRPERKREAV